METVYALLMRSMELVEFTNKSGPRVIYPTTSITKSVLHIVNEDHLFPIWQITFEPVQSSSLNYDFLNFIKRLNCNINWLPLPNLEKPIKGKVLVVINRKRKALWFKSKDSWKIYFSSKSKFYCLWNKIGSNSKRTAVKAFFTHFPKQFGTLKRER